MGRAARGSASSPAPSSASPRRNGLPPSAPLLTWETERELTLLELRRADLRTRIARLKPRSHARIVLEAELQAVTRAALRAKLP